MKTIEFTQDGIAISDFEAEEKALQFFAGDEETIRVFTANFITASRTLICRKIYPHSEIQFLFQRQYLKPDEDGRLPHWPRGFCDHEQDWLCVLLRGSKGK